MTPVVADASPLIALQQIDCLELLEALFGVIAIPAGVAEEIAQSVPLRPWMTVAIETRAPRLLVDERAARRIAEALGLPVIGTLGVLLAAKRRGEVDAIRPLMEALQQQGFWIARSLMERVIAVAGEM